MSDETLLKIYALRDKVDTETLTFITHIIVDVFKEGIEVGINAAKKKVINV